MPTSAPAVLRGAGAGGIVAMLALSLALRAPYVSVPPVVAEMGEALGASPSQMALLTSIPVLCFGLITPGSSWVLGRLGLRVSGAICLIGVVLGAALRSGGTLAMAILGTVLVGVAISLGNLVVPVLIGRCYPMRAGVLMGAYTATMNVGSTAATAATAVLAVSLGWPLATGVWGVVLGGVGLLLWLLLLPRSADHDRHRPTTRAGSEEAEPTPDQAPDRTPDQAPDRTPSATAPDTSHGPTAGRPPAPVRASRNPTTWLLAFAFAGQAMSWYGVTAWLPEALGDVAGLSIQAAGVGAAGFQVAGIVGPMLVPAFLALVPLRGRAREVALVATICAMWAALPLGMILAPQAWVVWVLVTGVAQGAFFTTIFLLVVRRTATSDENRRMAAIVQSFGYTAAALAPILIGWVHERVPGWDVLFLAVGAFVAVMTVAGLLAALRPEPPRTAVI
ncbi:CynX/NimT family MFS transporter [Serinibacter salmoneus]|uniref:CP family cyanate transporter-like MFS transporter n=1 Tax=Serinibacter salmoneus TaxID=556530 RepID=A0A2A9CW36_9MICO|nr:MFS transporter [Serinibacter salmoneus]PFG18644.1 CP family cyanate transporter-like MFS transporter [Serinibacter salmoneus]